jgi:hypothetical protein
MKDLTIDSLSAVFSAKKVSEKQRAPGVRMYNFFFHKFDRGIDGQLQHLTHTMSCPGCLPSPISPTTNTNFQYKQALDG